MSVADVRFTRALVRPPAASYAQGLTSAGLGPPDLSLALVQHAAYCDALTQLGLSLTRLPADADFPDSTFVEDTAIVTARGAIVTRPGAISRAGEVSAIRRALAVHFGELADIAAPGTVDGGDICQAGEDFFIGLSQRTNASGAAQLTAWLQSLGFTASTVDMRHTRGLLHLKSGVAWLGGRQLLVAEALAGHAEFVDYEQLVVRSDETYAANCVRIGDTVLTAAGYPELEGRLAAMGHRVAPLSMSEFQKMDGGLSCLSLRW